MNDPEREIVRIGVSEARIVGVTRERIDYIDEAGQEQFIDLEECAGVGGEARSNRAKRARLERTVCVGQRGALDNPPWAEFMNERKTHFEFATYEDLYGELLTPLRQAGWHTFDTN